MRFFLDTNVLVSGSRFNGNEATLLRKLTNRDPPPLTSEEVLHELVATLRHKFGYTEAEAATAARGVRGWCAVAQDPSVPVGDPFADQRILVAAAHAVADYFVTGDRALLHRKVVDGVAIIRTADALRILGV